MDLHGSTVLSKAHVSSEHLWLDHLAVRNMPVLSRVNMAADPYVATPKNLKLWTGWLLVVFKPLEKTKKTSVI